MTDLHLEAAEAPATDAKAVLDPAVRRLALRTGRSLVTTGLCGLALTLSSVVRAARSSLDVDASRLGLAVWFGGLAAAFAVLIGAMWVHRRIPPPAPLDPRMRMVRLDPPMSRTWLAWAVGAACVAVAAAAVTFGMSRTLAGDATGTATLALGSVFLGAALASGSLIRAQACFEVAAGDGD